MDKDKQRIAIAEACGWKLLEGPRTDAFGCYEGIGPKTMKWALNGNCSFAWQQFKEDADRVLPDYLNDLNAINDAVNYLRNANRMAYLTYGKRLDQLVAIYNSSPEQQAYHGILTCDAPADMRARAVLESLNLWTPTGEENE